MIVGLTYDLRSVYLAQGYSECAVAELDAEETVESLAQALASHGHCVVRIGTAKELCARLCAGERWDIVYNIGEGMHGRAREAQIPCILDAFRIPYTCSDALVCAVTLDKALTKRIVRDAGVSTPQFALVHTREDAHACALRYPLFVKPVAEGTGKGITTDSLVATSDRLADICTQIYHEYGQAALVEEYLPGREFTVGIIGTGNNARVIGTMEIAMRDKDTEPVYSYDIKEEYALHCVYSTPPMDTVRAAVEECAYRAYRALECRDVGRVDIRLDAQGTPHFMEINVLPGMHPVDSDLPMIATRAGISYSELVGMILASAVARL